MARSQKKKKKQNKIRLLWYGEEEKEMGARRAERMDGPSGDGTNEKKEQKQKSQNRLTEIIFSSSFSHGLKSQLKRKKFTNNK